MTVWFMVLASFCARAESELPLVVHLRRQLLYVYVMADELAGLQATAEDLAGPVRRGPQPRDSWMTDLPPERVPTTLAPQGNQNTFSQKGIRSRGDTSDWTMTPAQRLLQLQGGSAGQNTITAGPSWEQDPRKAAQTAAAVDAYLGANRKKSLVEQHNEKKVKKRKAAAVEGKSVADRQGEWEGKHPWRPFD